MRKEAYEHCLYCGANGIEWHHVTLRSQGGTDGPQIPLCRRCHERRHNELLRIEMRGENVVFTEVATGEITIRRMVPQLSTGPSQLVDEARAIQQWLRNIVYSDTLKSEPDEALRTLYDEIRSLKHGAWMAQAAIIAEMQSRSSYGDSMAKHVAQALGCNERTVQSRGQIFREIISKPEAKQACELLTEESFYKEAVSAPDPIQAINYAAERKAGDPTYSVAKFREELKLNGEESSLRGIVLICDGPTSADERIADQLWRRYGVPVRLQGSAQVSGGAPERILYGVFADTLRSGDTGKAVSL